MIAFMYSFVLLICLIVDQVHTTESTPQTNPPAECYGCRMAKTCGQPFVTYDGTTLTQCKVQCWAIPECLSIEHLILEDICSLYECSETTTEKGNGYEVIRIRDGYLVTPSSTTDETTTRQSRETLQQETQTGTSLNNSVPPALHGSVNSVTAFFADPINVTLIAVSAVAAVALAFVATHCRLCHRVKEYLCPPRVIAVLPMENTRDSTPALHESQTQTLQVIRTLA